MGKKPSQVCSIEFYWVFFLRENGQNLVSLWGEAQKKNGTA